MEKLWQWFKERHIVWKILIVIVLLVVVVGGLFFLVSLLVTALWNWLMPEIFGLPTIDHFQAMGLLVLVSIFKGVVSSGSNSSENKSECSKETSYPQEKDDYDKKYEAWWNEKGEASFNQFIDEEAVK